MSVYNEKKVWINQSIESIINQTYKNIEFIIVLDNPDNEDIKRLLKFYEEQDNRIKLIFNQKNMGLVKSLNIALSECTGKYIARMDADDICKLDRLSIQKKYLETNNLDFVFSSMIIIDEESNELYSTNMEQLDYKQVKSYLEKGNISTHPTWFLKAEVYNSLNGYRTINSCEDYDFILRALKKEFKIGKIGQNLLQYRIRNNSISRSSSLEQFLNSRGILKLYKNNNLEKDKNLFEVLQQSKLKSSKHESQKFLKANNKYYQGVFLFKNNSKLKGIFIIFCCLFESKYFVLKMIDTLKYKILTLKLF